MCVAWAGCLCVGGGCPRAHAAFTWRQWTESDPPRVGVLPETPSPRLLGHIWRRESPPKPPAGNSRHLNVPASVTGRGCGQRPGLDTGAGLPGMSLALPSTKRFPSHLTPVRHLQSRLRRGLDRNHRLLLKVAHSTDVLVRHVGQCRGTGVKRSDCWLEIQIPSLPRRDLNPPLKTSNHLQKKNKISGRKEIIKI